jgi:hypothetical protein
MPPALVAADISQRAPGRQESHERRPSIRRRRRPMAERQQPEAEQDGAERNGADEGKRRNHECGIQLILGAGQCWKWSHAKIEVAPCLVMGTRPPRVACRDRKPQLRMLQRNPQRETPSLEGQDGVARASLSDWIAPCWDRKMHPVSSDSRWLRFNLSITGPFTSLR